MSRAETNPPSWPTSWQLGVGGPGQHDVVGDARHLVVGALAAEEVGVDLGLPGPKARARPGAEGAALHPVGAVVGPAVGVDVERLVVAVVVVVAEHVVGADHDAGGAAGAQARGDHLVYRWAQWSFSGGTAPSDHRSESGAGRGAMAVRAARGALPSPGARDAGGRVLPSAGRGALGRQIESWSVPDRRTAWAPARRRPALRRALVGEAFTAARRHGKLLLLDTATAARWRRRVRRAHARAPLRHDRRRSLLDDRAAVDRLLYSPGPLSSAQWVRLPPRLADGGELACTTPGGSAGWSSIRTRTALGPDALRGDPRRAARRAGVTDPWRRSARSRPGSRTRPTWPASGTCWPTRSSGGPAFARAAVAAPSPAPSCGGFTGTCGPRSTSC